MELIDVWRSKVKKTQPKKEKERVPCPKAPVPEPKGKCPADCPSPDQPHRNRRDGHKKKPRKQPKSLSELGKVTGDDCCACCSVLANYLKEVCKLIWCVSGSAKEGMDTKVGELFCELVHITYALGQDCCDFIRYVIKCLLVYKK